MSGHTYPAEVDAMLDHWETVRQRLLDYPSEHHLLLGPPGTGKTAMGHWLAGQTGQPLFQTVATDNGSKWEFLGIFNPKSGDWIPGAGHLAAQAGGILLINELDKMSQEQEDVLHALADGGLGANIILPDGTVLTPQAGYRIVATQNAAFETLLPSVQDRFIPHEVASPGREMLDALSSDYAVACAFGYLSVWDAKESPPITYRQYARMDRIRAQIMARTGADLLRAELESALIVLRDRAVAETFVDALRTARA